VEVLHVRVGRSVIKIEVVLFHVLAVVPLGWSEAEQPFLQNRVIAVPECQSEHKELVAVADCCDPVFAPPVRLVSSRVVR
jgi:hypothetical protein